MNSLRNILLSLDVPWRLLVLGLLLARVLAGGGLSFLWFKTYGPVAILRRNKQEMALINSAPVFGPLIERFGLLPGFDGIQGNARQSLVKMRSRAAGW